MKVGFTGTQIGMSDEQGDEFLRFIGRYEITEFHHGDCVGADSDAVYCLSYLSAGIKIIGHPPINDKKRAYIPSDESKAPKEYLDRNHSIVDETDMLLAFPGQKEEVLRSGTWATIRYAKKKKKPMLIVYPDGTFEGYLLPLNNLEETNKDDTNNSHWNANGDSNCTSKVLKRSDSTI